MWYLTDTEGLYNKTLFITLSEITTRTNYGTQIRLSCVSPLRAVEVACSSGLRHTHVRICSPACTWAQSRGECGERGRIPEQQRLADTVIYFIACCLARVRGKTVVWCLSAELRSKRDQSCTLLSWTLWMINIVAIREWQTAWQMTCWQTWCMTPARHSAPWLHDTVSAWQPRLAGAAAWPGHTQTGPHSLK